MMKTKTATPNVAKAKPAKAKIVQPAPLPVMTPDESDRRHDRFSEELNTLAKKYGIATYAGVFVREYINPTDGHITCGASKQIVGDRMVLQVEIERLTNIIRLQNGFD